MTSMVSSLIKSQFRQMVLKMDWLSFFVGWMVGVGIVWVVVGQYSNRMKKRLAEAYGEGIYDIFD